MPLPRFPRLRSRSIAGLGLLAASSAAVTWAADTPRLILDMVHHNPGEARYESRYNQPSVLEEMGYNGKVYFLFESPVLAIDWSTVAPDIFPVGSGGRAWIDTKAREIDAQHQACLDAGIDAYAQSDLVLLPKALIARLGVARTYGDPRDPKTRELLRAMVAETFDRFPRLAGLVVRIGETYLHDAPHHQGHINAKNDADATIIPLVRLLRDEVCEKRGRRLIFRTWLAFDKDLDTYLKVGAAVEPHPLLAFGVKHCEGDFHRGNPFSRILGQGRHPQVVEVQCAREYEGKGAYPNYVAHGVIEGFEEHPTPPVPGGPRNLRELARDHPETFAGLWTWTRGGGWRGPYIRNELWPDLNAWVLARWAADPAVPEETLFRRYAAERLGLTGEDVDRFRRLCLLSASATLRGKASARSEMAPWWSRDDGINRPPLPKNPEARARVLADQAEAVRQWREIVALGDAIAFPDPRTADFVRVSTRYGHSLFRIYRAVCELVAAEDDPDALRAWLPLYDEAWAAHRALPALSPQCASLYNEASAPVGPFGEGVEKIIPLLRARAAATPPPPNPPSGLQTTP